MKSKWIFALSCFLVFTGLLFSCEKEEDEGDENESKISHFNGDESHNMGQNCMTCHIQGGEGEGRFIVAGTVYDKQKANPLPNASIRLYSAANGGGELVATLEADQKGNFFTTEAVDFGTGLYAQVEGSTSKNTMIMPLTSGQCNSCHGISTDRIWTQ